MPERFRHCTTDTASRPRQWQSKLGDGCNRHPVRPEAAISSLRSIAAKNDRCCSRRRRPRAGEQEKRLQISSLEYQRRNLTMRKPTTITRRSLLMAGAAVPLCSVLTRRAFAAEFSYKLATGQDPTHPVNIRAQEASDRIREATGGRLEIKLFPANQLGSDTELLTQVRNGGVEFFNQSSSILATFVPTAGVVNTGFAFANYESVWQAMDGGLGA